VTGKKTKKHEEAAGHTSDETINAAADEETGNKEKDAAAEREELRRQLAECEDKKLRMAADFDNARKRLEREREISLKYAEETLLKEMLPSLDNLERALAQGRETDNFDGLLEGVTMTLNGLLAAMEKVGLKPIDSVGEAFDPNFHEAVAMDADADAPESQILKEFQKGYMFKDRLLRAAKVVVACGAPTAE
jgi:molecular chaperone GrpE